MRTVEHMLIKHGVLKTFNISRKISPTEAEKIKQRALLKCKNKSDFKKVFEQEVLNFTLEIIKKQRVPGVISPHVPKELRKQKSKTILKKSEDIVQFCIDNDLKNSEIIYLMYLITKMLGITEEDFKKYWGGNE